MDPKRAEQAIKQARALLVRTVPGSRHGTIRAHLARSELIAQKIWQRFQVGPYQAKARHFRWYLKNPNPPPFAVDPLPALAYGERDDLGIGQVQRLVATFTRALDSAQRRTGTTKAGQTTKIAHLLNEGRYVKN